MARGRALALVGGDRGVGVDTLRLGFEAERRVVRRKDDWTMGRDLDAGGSAVKRFRRLPGYGVFESWDAPVGSRARMWVEASLPKRVTWDGVAGSNVVPVPLERAECVGRGMLAELEAEGWVRDVSAVELRRVDVVRDFAGVPDVQAVISVLRGSVSAAALRMRQASWRGERKGVSTVSWGNRSHQATLYDKSYEARLAQPGHLRYEYRCRFAALRRAGVVSFAQLPGTLELAKGVFDALGWGSDMVTGTELRERVMGSALVWRGVEVSPRVRAGLFLFLSSLAGGIESPFSRKTCWKYRYLARQLGVVLADESGEQEEEPERLAVGGGGFAEAPIMSVGSFLHAGQRGRRLDWSRGTVVAA